MEGSSPEAVAFRFCHGFASTLALPHASERRNTVPRAQAGKPPVEALARLVEAVERVSEELSALYQILDQIRDDFGWALKNDRFRTIPEAAMVTSLPRDPLAPDWNERVNRIALRERAEVVAATAAAQPPTASQRHLW
jgi:hypothetical protein